MYAVILTGGKQYRITAGDVIHVERLDAAAGDTVTIDQVLALSGSKTLIGAPRVEGAKVEAQVLEQIRDDKVLIFKKKRRHNYRRLNGHRQYLTTLHVTNILFNGASLAKVDAKKLRAAPPAFRPAKKTLKNGKTAAAAKPAPKKEAAAKPAAKKPAEKKAAK